MGGTSILGLVLALLVTGAIFGTAYFVVSILPTLASGDAMGLARWAAAAAIGGVLVYRQYGRVRGRRKKRSALDDED